MSHKKSRLTPSAVKILKNLDFLETLLEDSSKSLKNLYGGTQPKYVDGDNDNSL